MENLSFFQSWIFRLVFRLYFSQESFKFNKEEVFTLEDNYYIKYWSEKAQKML